MAAGPCRSRKGQAATASAGLPRAHDPAAPYLRDDDRHPRRLEREVQAHLRVAAHLAHMARGFPARPRLKGVRLWLSRYTPGGELVLDKRLPRVPERGGANDVRDRATGYHWMGVV